MSTGNVSITIFLFITGFCGSSEAQKCSTTDPCNWNKHTPFPYPENRHPTVAWQPSVHTQCDLYSLSSNVWYMAVFNISSQCPDYQHCGTKHPVWLNGGTPSPDEGIVMRHACVRTFDNCCANNYTVYAKNCHYYSVYCLDDIPLSCPERYCMDIDLSVVTTTTTTTTRTTTTAPPSTTQKNEGRIQNDNWSSKEAVIALSVCLVGAICAILALVVAIFFIKTKTASSVLPEKPQSFMS